MTSQLIAIVDNKNSSFNCCIYFALHSVPDLGCKNSMATALRKATTFDLYATLSWQALQKMPQTVKFSRLQSVAAAIEEQASAAAGVRTPSAIILEPSRDLAQQTHDAITSLKRDLTSPSLQSVLLVGGTQPKEAVRQLERGADIVTGTPGPTLTLVVSCQWPHYVGSLSLIAMVISVTVSTSISEQDEGVRFAQTAIYTYLHVAESSRAQNATRSSHLPAENSTA